VTYLPGVIALLALTGVARADLILGAQVGQQSLKIKQTDNLGNVYEDTADGDTSLGLIIGIGQAGAGGSRITGEWSSFGIGGDADLNLLNVGYTGMLPALNSSSALKLRPFVGAELGYGWLDVDQQAFFNGGDDSGLIYGARAGLNLAVTERAEIEVGLRYSRVGLDAELPGSSPAHFDVESNQGWWIGFNVGL